MLVITIAKKLLHPPLYSQTTTIDSYPTDTIARPDMFLETMSGLAIVSVGYVA